MGNDEIPNDVSCAISVNNVYQNAFGNPIGGGASTYLLYQALRKNLRFVRISLEKADAGDLIIAPSGYGTNPDMPHGHVGIISAKGKIMSNNSDGGLWDEHFTIDSFLKRYKREGGYPIYIYRVY